MKKGKEIGITPLSDKVKGMPATATVPYYAINSILFEYTNSYIAPRMANHIYERLCEQASAFKNADVGVINKGAQDAVLLKLRNICKRLRDYYETYEWTQDDVASINSTITGQLFLCLDPDDSDFDLSKALARNKEIWDNMYLPCPFKDQIIVKKFRKMHKGLMTRLVNQFQLTTDACREQDNVDSVDNADSVDNIDSVEQFNECVLWRTMMNGKMTSQRKTSK